MGSVTTKEADRRREPALVRAGHPRTPAVPKPKPKAPSASPTPAQSPCLPLVESRDGISAHPHTKKALDLFSGTGSVAKRLRNLGYEVITLDINPKFKPDIQINVLDWKYRPRYPVGYFDLIVASPPCEEYSQAKTTKKRELAYADKCVQKTLEIVRYFSPNYGG